MEKREAEKTDLRKKAEQVLAGRPPAGENLSALQPEERDRLVHELRVHQIELELQNEELRKAQLELQAAHDRYLDLYDFSPHGYLTISGQGLISEANLTAARMLGIERGFLIGKPLSGFVFPADQDIFYLCRRKVLETRSNHSCEVRLVQKDGFRFHARLACTLFNSDTGETDRFRLGISDIEDYKQAVEERMQLAIQLQQAQKMEAIGTMAGGIAHDFNNILGIMIGNVEYALETVPEGNPARESLLEIHAAGLRAKEMVKQILNFSRQSITERKPLKITPIIAETLKLLRASIPANIAIRKRMEAEHDTVLADEAQINQIVMNLCTNAFQAMQKKGGILGVYLKNVTLDRGPDSGPARYLRLSVSDTGMGIDPDIIGKIFDPYFTTKNEGKGTGMGLAVINGIVQNYDGHISIQNKPGKGATFHVFLPVVEAEPVCKPEAATTTKTGKERLLFVDDEPGLVRVYSAMLRRLGYQVTACTDPREALQIIKKKPEAFDLVITDFAMPNMSGHMLAKEVNGLRPDVPIILCSGYSDMTSEAEIKDAGVCTFVMKPFIKGDLANAVRKALDEKKRKD